MVELINVPYSLRWNQKSRQKVIRVPALDKEEFKKATRESFLFYKKNSQYLTFELDMIDNVDFLASLNFRKTALILHAFTKYDIEAIVSLQSKFKAFDKVEIILHKNVDDIVKNIEKLIFDDNIYVRFSVEFLKELSSSELKKAYEDIAFNPDVLSHVYPFVSLVRYFDLQAHSRDKVDRTLWRFMQEEVGLFYYVTSDGKCSVSKRFADKSMYFGTIEDSIEKMKESEFYKSLDSVDEEIFFTYDKCAVCEEYKVCGALPVYDDMQFDCSAVVNLLKDFKNDLEDIMGVVPKKQLQVCA